VALVSLIRDATQGNNYYLKESDGTVKLDSSHGYYYQVQTQMLTCDVNVCTFVEGKEKRFTLPDNNHFGKSTRAFLYDLSATRGLGQLVQYTQDNICSSIATDSELPSGDRPSNSNPISSSNTSSYTIAGEHTFCYFHGPVNRSMIACDNPDSFSAQLICTM